MRPFYRAPRFKLFPSSYPARALDRWEKMEGDLGPWGKQGKQHPPPGGNTYPTPMTPSFAHRGLGRNPLLGSFLPHFPFVCDLTPHPLPP